MTYFRHLTFDEYVGNAALDFYAEHGRWVRFILPKLRDPQGSNPQDS
jgi:hypothetical protein